MIDGLTNLMRFVHRPADAVPGQRGVDTADHHEQHANLSTPGFRPADESVQDFSIRSASAIDAATRKARIRRWAAACQVESQI
jgi:hypothetical protein